MKKCLVIPDSFKGSLSSIDACLTIKEAILKHAPTCEVLTIPVADGGEGTVDCFVHAVSAERIWGPTTGPYGEVLTCEYARSGETAFIEMAQCAGLPLTEHAPDPSQTTTYGVGTLLRHAVEHGCTKLIIGLGGSATNDAGVGMAQALGVRFYEEEDREFSPVGATLNRIRKIDCHACTELLQNCTVTAMCDIDNPMFGEQGAAAVFAPQKGADAQMVSMLDGNLRALAQTIRSELHVDVSTLPGAGAAGAMGAGIAAFLDGTLQSGIETVLDAVAFDRLLEDADLVLTGEGKLDSQSLHGKVVAGVARRAKRQGVPVVVLAGAVSPDAEEAYALGVTAAFSITQEALPFSEARHHSREFLRREVENLMRFSRIFSSPNT